MKHLGVDACSSGWVAGIFDDGGLRVERFEDVETLWTAHSDAERVLIDIPIGLPETG